MTFPTGTVISTSNLATGAADPSQARADLYDAVTALNSIIADANTAGGVLVLDVGGKVPSTQFPTNINVTGDLTLSPSTGIVTVQSLLRLSPKFIGDLAADYPTPNLGDIVSTYDGDAGNPCLAMYDGTDWKIIALGATVNN